MLFCWTTWHSHRSACVWAFAESISIKLLSILPNAVIFEPIEEAFQIVKRNERSTVRIAEAFSTLRHTGAHVVILAKVLVALGRSSPKGIEKYVRFRK